jgi:hypothetical protein
MSFDFSKVKWGRVVLWSVLGLIIAIAIPLLYVTVRMFIIGFQIGGNPGVEVQRELSSGPLYMVIWCLAMALGGFLGGRAPARKAEGSYLLNGLLGGLGVAILFAVFLIVTGSSFSLIVLLWVVLAIAASALGGWIGGHAAEAEAYA